MIIKDIVLTALGFIAMAAWFFLWGYEVGRRAADKENNKR